METLQIEFQPNVKEKILEFLNSFSKNEVKITQEEEQVIEDEAFISYRDKLQLEAKRVASGESKLRSLEELDDYLEKIISKYES
jgi:hypothetical protein